jgi:tetratricopeptide (TPR) repeat protein
MPDDAPPLSSDDVEAAASVGRLPALTRQLVLDGAWSSVDVLLRYARDAALPLGELEETVRAMAEAIAALSEARRNAARDEIVALERQAAFAITKRLDRDPLTATERKVLALAAGLLVDLGDLERAALTFERAGDDARAAEAYGGLGDLDRMEACLARDERRRRQRQSVSDALRRFDTLLAAGERQAAVALAAGLPGDDFEASTARAQAREVERRLCRGGGLTLRAGSEAIRFAATPATLGRDGQCEVVLRDPGVSRRHAVIQGAAGATALTVVDAGSRGGTLLGAGLVRGPVSLQGEGELGLGEHCRLRFRVVGPALLELVGVTGIDRSLRAIVGAGAVPLALAVPGAEGVTLRLGGPVCRLERTPATTVRVDGRLIGAACDLLVGDVIEVPATGVRLEVT